jgi:hypothetical protein
MPLFTFTQTLRNALPLNDTSPSCGSVISSPNEETGDGAASVPDEELEGMLPNPPTSGKVRAYVFSCINPNNNYSV